LEQFDPVQRAYLSAWIREHGEVTIYEKDISYLQALEPPPVGEKADRLLMHLAKECPKAGTRIDVGIFVSMSVFDESDEPTQTLPNDGKLFALTWTQDADELRFIFDDYLVAETGYLKQVESGLYKITPKGWLHLDELSTKRIASSSGFVAMWFNPCMNLMFAAVERAITSAGYRAVRIDRQEHNNRIDDEILAALRRSKFVVADFTEQRGGVYFEAGFGLGLGLQVIWLCRHDHLEKVHFDNRQYNFILWTDDKLDELERALKNRIEATIGRGPLKPLDVL